MGSTDPLTGARFPQSPDSPNIAQYIQNAVNDLSDIIGGKFATASARDTAFSNWVAQGNTMSDGLRCTVGGRMQVYVGSAWLYVGGKVVIEQFPTFGGGWSNQAGFDALRCWIDGSGIIHVTGTVSAVSFGAATTMATLPTGFRPNGAVSRRVYVGQSQTPQRLDINTDGTMVVTPTQTWSAAYWTVDTMFHPNAGTTAST